MKNLTLFIILIILVKLNALEADPASSCKKKNYFANVKPIPKASGKCANVNSYPYDIPEFKPNSEEYKKIFTKDYPFPGKVDPGGKRETIKVAINTKFWGWHSTGTYAAPGEVVTVRIFETALEMSNGIEYSIRIGSHTDESFPYTKSGDLFREKKVTESIKIHSSETKIENKYGGLVYFEVSKANLHDTGNSFEPNGDKKYPKFEIEIENVIRSPRFILGKTTLSEWLNEERCNPAPWAEFENDRIVITVPSSIIRKIDNPEPVMEFWKDVLKTQDGMAGYYGKNFPRKEILKRKERIVSDVNIKAGYMHSGYPVMTYLDVAHLMVNMELIDDKKEWSPSNSKLLNVFEDRVWGFFHELGHNKQIDWWTYDGLTEVTTNWFSLETFCSIYGIPHWKNPWLHHSDNLIKARKFLQLGNPNQSIDRFTQLGNSEAGVALIQFAQIMREFGIEPFKKIIQLQIDNLPVRSEMKNLSPLMSRWVLEISKATKRDMRDFYKQWGYLVDQANEELDKLKFPKWEPIGLLKDSFLEGDMEAINTSGKDKFSYKWFNLYPLNFVSERLHSNPNSIGTKVIRYRGDSNAKFANKTDTVRFEQADKNSYKIKFLFYDGEDKCVSLKDSKALIDSCNSENSNWVLNLYDKKDKFWTISPRSNPTKFLNATKDSNEIIFTDKVDPVTGDGLWLPKSALPVEK